MKNVSLVLSLVVALYTICLPTVAQEPAQPTEHHKILKMDEGVWEAEMKIWMAGPDSDPMVSKGIETNKMMGDFWVVSSFEGDFMGQKFLGHGVFGYDPEKQKFVGTWSDSTSPYMSHMEGTWDPETKSMTMMMSGREPDGSEMTGKNVAVHKDANTRVFTMYSKADGEYIKSAEITYKRKK